MNFTRGLLIGLVALVAAFPGAGQDVKPPPPPKQFNLETYPIATGFRWVYRVTDRKAPKMPEGAAKTPATVVVTAGGKQLFSVKRNKQDEPNENVVGFDLQVLGGGKTLQEQVLVDRDGVYRVSGAGKSIVPPLRILKANAKKGESWTCDSQSENANMKGEFVILDDAEVVQVPAGSFKTVLVRSRDFMVGAQPLQIATWYAPNIGMVKQHIQTGNHEVVLELEKYEKK
jgi:hypothetical protein